MGARSILARIRDDLIHAAQACQAHDRCVELQDEYERTPEGADELGELGAQIADHLEAIAGHLEASRVARHTVWFDAAELRREAAQWRAGTMRVGS